MSCSKKGEVINKLIFSDSLFPLLATSVKPVHGLRNAFGSSITLHWQSLLVNNEFLKNGHFRWTFLLASVEICLLWLSRCLRGSVVFLSNPIDFFLCGSKTRYCTVDTEEVQSSHTHASTPQRKSRLLNIPNMHLIIAGCDVSGLTTYIAALQPPEWKGWAELDAEKPNSHILRNVFFQSYNTCKFSWELYVYLLFNCCSGCWFVLKYGQ